jgi:hypothetical protein
VAVQVLAGAVVSHGGARVGMACGYLDVAQVDSRVKHCGNERVPQHMRVRAADAHPASPCEMTKTTGGGVRVHPRPAAVEQDWPRRPAADGAVDSTTDGRRQRDQNDLGSFAAHPKHAVAVFFPQVGDVGAGGFEDPQSATTENRRETVEGLK